jgi:hypothetical protein
MHFTWLRHTRLRRSFPGQGQGLDKDKKNDD